MAEPRDKKPPPIPKLAEQVGPKQAVIPTAKPAAMKNQLPSLAEMSTEGLPSVVVDLGDPSHPKLSEDATMILPARQVPAPVPAKKANPPTAAQNTKVAAKPPAVSVGEATLILNRAPDKKEPAKTLIKEPSQKEPAKTLIKELSQKEPAKTVVKELPKDSPRRLDTDAKEDAATVITKAAKVIEPIAAPLAKPAPLMLQGKPLPSPKPQASAVIPQPVLSAPPSIPPPKLPPKEPPRASEPPIHKQMERRIRELIHKFDVPALVDALAAAGYREDQIEFVSNPVLTHRASLLEDIEFFRDPPRVLVLTNYGLLGGQGPIPSYFFELLSEQRDSTMTEFLWFFDNALLRQRYAGLFPERDRDIIADFAEVKQLQLALLQLGAPIGMHWLFRLVYPELPVAVRRSIQKRRVRTDGVRMGDAELGSGCAFGGFTQVPVGGIDVRLLCEEWNTPTGQPWAHAAEQRLQRLIIPSLESSDVYLTVTLIFLDRQSFAKLAPQTYLGYDPIAAPPSDDGPPPVQQVILFRGETGRSPH